jgi:hypothetical protein
VPYEAKVYQVMIASPSDVRDERRLAADIVLEWNVMYSRKAGVVLLPARWETHTAPAAGSRPQEIINRQVLQDSDLLVAMFWTRIGTPTGEAVSGTVEEIEQHLAARKPAMLYFRAAPVIPTSVDEGQYGALRDIQEKWRKKHLICEYNDSYDFERSFRRQLSITLNTDPYFEIPGTIDVDVHWESASVTLSDDAQILLLEASQDPSGTILRLRLDQGDQVISNGKSFSTIGDPRSEARWNAAVDELENAGYISDRGYKREVYGFTHSGYQMADMIRSELKA